MEDIGVLKKIEGFAREKASGSGYVFVNVHMRGGGRHALVEVVLDKEGGIGLDECSSFNKELRGRLEEEKMFFDGFALDVCSPGLDRQLKDDNDFLWAIDKKVVVKTREPLDGKSAIEGRLVKPRDGELKDKITVEDDAGDLILISKSNISGAKLLVTA